MFYVNISIFTFSSETPRNIFFKMLQKSAQVIDKYQSYDHFFDTMLHHRHSKRLNGLRVPSWRTSIYVSLFICVPIDQIDRIAPLFDIFCPTQLSVTPRHRSSLDALPTSPSLPTRACPGLRLTGPSPPPPIMMEATPSSSLARVPAPSSLLEPRPSHTPSLTLLEMRLSAHLTSTFLVQRSFIHLF